MSNAERNRWLKSASPEKSPFQLFCFGLASTLFLINHVVCVFLCIIIVFLSARNPLRLFVVQRDANKQ